MSQQGPKEGVSTAHSVPSRFRRLEVDECRHLANLEAIPFRHGGRLSIVRRACVDVEGDAWCVINTNLHGPRTDICYRIPGPKNNWLARLSDRSTLNELSSIIFAHETKDQKRCDYIHYLSKEMPDGEEPGMSLIIECIGGSGNKNTEILPTEVYDVIDLQDWGVGFKFLVG